MKDIRQHIVEYIQEEISGDRSSANAFKSELDSYKSSTISSGTSFPDSPKENDIFIFEGDSTGYIKGDIFRHEGSTWVKKSNIVDISDTATLRSISSGIKFPDTQMKNDVFIFTKKSNLPGDYYEFDKYTERKTAEKGEIAQYYKAEEGTAEKTGWIWTGSVASLFLTTVRGLRVYDPSNPPDHFGYECGLKSVSTQSSIPTPGPDENVSGSDTNLSELPILYYGYGGVGDSSEELAAEILRGSQQIVHAVDEESETLAIYIYVKFTKFGKHTNIINTAACIHGMISQFILNIDLGLDRSLQETASDSIIPEELGNIAQVRLGSVVPFFQGLGRIEWLRFEMLIDFIYRRDAE